MNSLRRIIPTCGRAASKVKSWFNPETVSDRMIRSILLGTLATVSIGELSAYRIIEQDVMAGQLNIFAIDFIIVGISLLEVLMGPFISWFGYNNRRMLILAWNIAVAVISLFWLALPGSTEIVESEYCNPSNNTARNTTTSSHAGVRVSVVVLSCIVFSLTKIVAWSHGMAYIEEYVPKRTSFHFGILLAFRVVSLKVFPKIIPSGQSIAMQAVSVAGGTIGNIVQLFLYMPMKLPPPEESSGAPWPNREFTASIARVIKNTLAMTQMVAIGLLAGALWGFAYYDTEIVKVKYHLNPVTEHSFGANLKLMLGYLVVIMSVLYVGLKFSSPILSEFCRFRGIKQATLMSVLTIILYILLMTLGNCDKGYVVGLEDSHYTSPECNLACGCIPRWREFSPVCVVDQLTTYLSPCQAGCSSSEKLNNIQVFTNCTCAPGSGRATIGACSLNNCTQAYELHNTLLITVLMTTVLAFQAQGMVLLRTVDPRDRSLALGVACAVVSSIAFGCGHLIYLGISGASCRWFEAGRCHLYHNSFPIYIGSTSAVMAFPSVTISIAIWVVMKLAERRQAKNDVSRSPEEQVLMNE